MSRASARMLKTADTPNGKTFVDAKGMTLYTFDKDAGGKSTRDGPCAENWPPLAAADDARPCGGSSLFATLRRGAAQAVELTPLP